MASTTSPTLSPSAADSWKPRISSPLLREVTFEEPIITLAPSNHRLMTSPSSPPTTSPDVFIDIHTHGVDSSYSASSSSSTPPNRAVSNWAIVQVVALDALLSIALYTLAVTLSILSFHREHSYCARLLPSAATRSGCSGLGWMDTFSELGLNDGSYLDSRQTWWCGLIVVLKAVTAFTLLQSHSRPSLSTSSSSPVKSARTNLTQVVDRSHLWSPTDYLVTSLSAHVVLGFITITFALSPESLFLTWVIDRIMETVYFVSRAMLGFGLLTLSALPVLIVGRWVDGDSIRLEQQKCRNPSCRGIHNKASMMMEQMEGEDGESCKVSLKSPVLVETRYGIRWYKKNLWSCA